MDFGTFLPDYAMPLLGGLLGLIIGSFLATVIIRWPQGRSVMEGRSQCDSCDTQLGPLELVPIASYILQKGKCRHCGASINRNHLAIELTAGLVGGIALAVSPDVSGLAGAIFGWILLTLAALDADHHWLPDRLTALLATTGLLSALVVEQPEVVDRLIGGIAGYFSLLLVAILYRVARGKEGLGGGDPKMLAGIGLWLGWQYLPVILLTASITGLLIVLFQKSQGRPVEWNSSLPLGSLMAVVAFPAWIIQSAGGLLSG